MSESIQKVSRIPELPQAHPAVIHSPQRVIPPPTTPRSHACKCPCDLDWPPELLAPNPRATPGRLVGSQARVPSRIPLGTASGRQLGRQPSFGNPSYLPRSSCIQLFFRGSLPSSTKQSANSFHSKGKLPLIFFKFR